MTQGEVAEQTNYALSTVSAYETGRLIPSSAFAERADEVFGTDDTDDKTGEKNGDLARLQRLVERVSVRPWFRDRIDVERQAAEIREYESYQICGLLQTEDYARAIVSSVRPVLPDDAIERAVALRMPLDQNNAPHLWAIIDESALYRAVGGPDIMKAQCEHLVTMARRPNIIYRTL